MKPRKSSPRPSFSPVSLLLAPELSQADVQGLFAKFGFRNHVQADRNLQSMAGDPQSRRLLADFVGDLLAAVGRTADPDQALNAWERYIELGPNRTQLFGYVKRMPRLLHILCAIFGNSPAMSQTLIRDPLLLYWMGEEKVLLRRPSRAALKGLLDKALEPFTSRERQLEALRRFKRREMLRIGVRDLLKLGTVEDTVTALSDLADLLVQRAYEIVAASIQEELGLPVHQDDAGHYVPTRFVVLGMGKLGGQELNYSSDIDVIYLYEQSHGVVRRPNGQTGVSQEEYFDHLARSLTKVLTEATQEGALFRVDLRLRPEGAIGAIVRPMDDTLQYYQTRGRTWERLAFIKARPIAGSLELGRTFLRSLSPFVLGMHPDANNEIAGAIQSLKSQIHGKMLRRGETERNVKLGTGGIREVEFIVQSLQLRHGRSHKKVLSRNTLTGLRRLQQAKFLTTSEMKLLRDAYLFLRDIEHKLQMVDELQTHQLPAELEELAKCAMRLGYPRKRSPEQTVAPFIRRYRHVTKEVHRLFERLVVSAG